VYYLLAVVIHVYETYAANGILLENITLKALKRPRHVLFGVKIF